MRCRSFFTSVSSCRRFAAADTNHVAEGQRLGPYHLAEIVTDSQGTPSRALRRAVTLFVLLNLGYFGIEFGVARTIGSVSLFADSIDFLEDAAVNGLTLVALGWSIHRRSIVGTILAAILFVPAVATGWTAWQKFNAPVPPAAPLL